MRETTEIWERQPGEPKRAYGYFCEYLKLGVTRSTKKVAENFGKAHGSISNYSSIWAWKKRSEAYDNYVEEIATLENIEGIKRMQQQYISVSQTVLVLAGKKLQGLYKQIKEAEKSKTAEEDIEIILKGMPMSIMPQLLQTSFEIERKCRGVTDKTENVQTLRIEDKEKEITDKFRNVLGVGKGLETPKVEE